MSSSGEAASENLRATTLLKALDRAARWNIIDLFVAALLCLGQVVGSPHMVWEEVPKLC